MMVMCEFWHSTRAPYWTLHAHGSSRLLWHPSHPAPLVASKNATHKLHSAADSCEEVLHGAGVGEGGQFKQPSSSPTLAQAGLVLPLHWLGAAAPPRASSSANISNISAELAPGQESARARMMLAVSHSLASPALRAGAAAAAEKPETRGEACSRYSRRDAPFRDTPWGRLGTKLGTPP